MSLGKDPDFYDKLKYYKTAYSPGYKEYVGIIRHHFDDQDGAIIVGRLAGSDKEILFRVCELTNFTL